MTAGNQALPSDPRENADAVTMLHNFLGFTFRKIIGEYNILVLLGFFRALNVVYMRNLTPT